jgi:ankyrin repeat protein
MMKDTRIDINSTNHKGSTPFLTACLKGHVEIVQLLLNDKRTDFKKINYYNETPLYSACRNGQVGVLELLLKDKRFEEDINKANENNETPFYIACLRGQEEVVRMMILDGRVNVNECSMEGFTPLYIACFCGHFDIVNILMRCDKVDFNKANLSGYTPLMITISQKYHYQSNTVEQLKNVETLLNDQRIDWNIQTKEEYKSRWYFEEVIPKGSTAFQVAQSFQRKEIIELFSLIEKDRKLKMNQFQTLNQKELLKLFSIACSDGLIDQVKIILPLLKRKLRKRWRY